jgi:hypothetical protein
MSDSEDRFLEVMKAAARSEASPSQLAERVLENVAYRLRLEAPLAARAPARARRARLLAAGCTGLAVAAAAWLFGRPPSSTSRIAAERSDRAPASAATPASARTSVLLPEPCRERVAAGGSSPLLDDFEDGDDALAPLEQRAGFWRWARESDAPGTAPALIPVPRADGNGRNKLALHVKGGRLFDWGATVEVNFRPPCYDASRYVGIKLQARGPGRVFVALREMGVIPLAEGGSCQRDCHNPHVAKLELSSDWRSYEVRWADLRQRGVDTPALDASRLHSVAFLIRAEDTPYDVWLDDVRFVPKGS